MIKTLDVDEKDTVFLITSHDDKIVPFIVVSDDIGIFHDLDAFLHGPCTITALYGPLSRFGEYSEFLKEKQEKLCESLLKKESNG